MVKKKLNSKNEYLSAQVLNLKTYNDFYWRLARIAMSMFEWENLPESMDAEFLEWCLFAYGQAALLYHEPYGGFVNTQCVTRGNLNLYYKPVQMECYGIDEVHIVRSVYNGLSEPKAHDEECILVENMYNRTPTMATLELYAMRLAEIQRSEDVNIKQQKFPALLLADPKKLLTIKNVYEQYSANTPVIVGDKSGLDLTEFKVVNTEAPFVADKLIQYRLKIFNEALSFLGVSNLNEKKERQLTNEVEKNNEEVNLNLQAFLVPRQKAARQFNLKFGFTGTDRELKVKVRSDIYNIIKFEESVIKDYGYSPLNKEEPDEQI